MTNPYAEFYLGSRSDIVQLELFEVTHPNFSKKYRIVRNAINGITVTLEPTIEFPSGEVAFFSYYPARVTSLEHRENLDSGFKIELGDLGEEIPVELDRVEVNDGYLTKPTVVYRTYRSDNLTTPLFGPFRLQLGEFTFNHEGAMFEAKAPSLNIAQTGEAYTTARFPMLRGFFA
jgi:hypothetical protein